MYSARAPNRNAAEPRPHCIQDPTSHTPSMPAAVVAAGSCCCCWCWSDCAAFCCCCQIACCQTSCPTQLTPSAKGGAALCQPRLSLCLSQDGEERGKCNALPGSKSRVRQQCRADAVHSAADLLLCCLSMSLLRRILLVVWCQDDLIDPINTVRGVAKRLRVGFTKLI